MPLGAGEERWPAILHHLILTLSGSSLGSNSLTPWRTCCYMVPGSAPDTPAGSTDSVSSSSSELYRHTSQEANTASDIDPEF